MSALKFFGITAVGLFVVVGIIGVVKKNSAHKTKEVVSISAQEEVHVPAQDIPAFAIETITYAPAPVVRETQLVQIAETTESTRPADVDRISRLFTTTGNKLPFVETVSYKSRVGWLQGRPAWIADYASYYTTSRHFIARSLNGNKDYYTQKVSSGDLFNVFKKDKDLRFHLVVDLTQLKMWFYAYDADTHIRYLLKTYRVGCGKPDKDSLSGCLTPLGTYMLGDKVAIYKPGVEGFFKDQKIEMIQVFGTRWLPYKGEQDETTAMIKGFGMHGSPWAFDEMKGELVEKRESIGTYDSSGCVRLLQEDIEEVFSIVITKPTTVHIVKNFSDVKLPGSEWIDPVVTDNSGG